jgi:hypothetical protein
MCTRNAVEAESYGQKSCSLQYLICHPNFAITHLLAFRVLKILPGAMLRTPREEEGRGGRGGGTDSSPPSENPGSVIAVCAASTYHAIVHVHVVHVACLLNGIFHGSVPDDFVVGTTILIPKNKNVDVTRSDNYRGITLSSVIGRISDDIIVRRHVSLLASCDLQF